MARKTRQHDEKRKKTTSGTEVKDVADPQAGERKRECMEGEPIM